MPSSPGPVNGFFGVDAAFRSGYPQERGRIERGRYAMRRTILAAGTLALGLTGCASTWETVSSRTFRESPMKALFKNDDAMTVLRTKVDGNARADAMRRLKEPAASGASKEEQDEALQMLGVAATTSPSPVIRTAAIDTLGRFRDPRAVKLLIAAYHKADGLPEELAKPDGVTPVGSIESTLMSAGMNGPLGFDPAFVSTLRSRTVTALSLHAEPEAIQFLGNVALTPTNKDDPASDRDVRAAAVRGLGQIKSPEAVAQLSRVLTAEQGKDVVLSQNAHDGLKGLTGKDLPADPKKWAEVVQAGGQVAPDGGGLQRAFGWMGGK